MKLHISVKKCIKTIAITKKVAIIGKVMNIYT